MSYPCEACNQTGDCNDDFHGLANSTNPFLGDDVCPACGQRPTYPGKCSVCGGTGRQEHRPKWMSDDDRSEDSNDSRDESTERPDSQGYGSGGGGGGYDSTPDPPPAPKYKGPEVRVIFWSTFAIIGYLCWSWFDDVVADWSGGSGDHYVRIFCCLIMDAGLAGTAGAIVRGLYRSGRIYFLGPEKEIVVDENRPDFIGDREP